MKQPGIQVSIVYRSVDLKICSYNYLRKEYCTWVIFDLHLTGGGLAAVAAEDGAAGADVAAKIYFILSLNPRYN